jgi:uncharacterized membrane protein HdeD (DUF308 family)
MLRALLNNWWLLALRGCFALLFAIAALTVAGAHSLWLLNSINLALITIVFGLFAFISGAFTLLAAFRCMRLEPGCMLLLLDGVATCVAGVLVVALPRLTLIHLVEIIAVWALVVACCELAIATRLWRHLPEERFLAFGAAGSMIFGYWLLSEGVETIEGALLWLGFYAAFSGSVMLLFAIRLRNLHSRSLHLNRSLHTANSFHIDLDPAATASTNDLEMAEKKQRSQAELEYPALEVSPPTGGDRRGNAPVTPVSASRLFSRSRDSD